MSGLHKTTVYLRGQSSPPLWGSWNSVWHNHICEHLQSAHNLSQSITAVIYKKENFLTSNEDSGTVWLFQQPLWAVGTGHSTRTGLQPDEDCSDYILHCTWLSTGVLSVRVVPATGVGACLSVDTYWCVLSA